MNYDLIGNYKYKDLERFTYAQLESDEILISNYPIILYDPFETEFDHHGVAVLENTLDAVITQELNGDYTLKAEIIKDERGKYKRVKPLSIVKAQGQLFRIPLLQGIKDDGFKITIDAKHISFDAVELYNEDRRANNQNIYETLSRLMEVDIKGKYSLGVTDVTKTASANFIDENFIESLFNKVLPRWGGELLRDNFKFTVKNRIGSYKPDLFIRYSKNSKSITRKVDYSSLCTMIYPYGKNGITIEEINRGIKYLTSSRINDYPLVYTKKVKFDDAETPEQLLEMATEYLNKYDKPLITVEVDLIDLENSASYENLKSAIRMDLGDTVTIYDEDLGIDEEQRVISMETDAVTGIKLKITLGVSAPSLADSMTDLEDKTSEIEQKVSENINTSEDIKTQVVQNTTDIIELKKIDENLNKDITAVNEEVGQLAGLNTTIKTDLVSAINEVVSMFDVSDEETQEKTNVVEVVKDLQMKVDEVIIEQNKIIELLKTAGIYPTE